MLQAISALFVSIEKRALYTRFYHSHKLLLIGHQHQFAFSILTCIRWGQLVLTLLPVFLLKNKLSYVIF